MTELRICQKCGGSSYLSGVCGVWVCASCEDHEGIVRCFCGWAADGGDGRQQLADMGENLEED